MLALDLVQGVAHHAEEVVVGGDDRPVHIELDDRLGLADGRDLTGKVGICQLLLGDFRGELDHLEWVAVEIEDRVVRRLDPDLLAALADPLELVRDVLPAVQLRPELLVLGTRPVSRLDEQAVMLALDLVQGVAHHAQEVVVGRNDRPVQVKLDHRLGLVDRGDLTFKVLNSVVGGGRGFLHFGSCHGFAPYWVRAGRWSCVYR